MRRTHRLLLAVFGGLFVLFFGLSFLITPGGGPAAAPGQAPPAAAGRAGASFPGPTGLQLYSLRNQLARDVPGTLDLVKGFGFRHVELAGTYGQSPDKFRAQLDSRGLKAVSGHFPFERLSTDVEGVARDAKMLGLEYVGGAWIPHDDKVPFDEKTCRAAIAVFNKAGQALAKHGLKFFYHVHGYEFQPHGSGTLFDLMLAETNPSFVSFEMDVFWIVHAGQDPVAMLQRHASRWPLMHMKGMKDGTPTGLFTGHSDVTNNVPVGTGRIDYPPILRAARETGVKWYFIEDESPAVLKQIPQSLSYLSTITLAGDATAPAPGAFSSSGDVGRVLKAGSVAFDAARGTYLVSGGGEDMWRTTDAFHFVWKKASGDVALAADIRLLGVSAHPHRKAGLIIRQSLDPDSAYADAVLHGNGRIDLQYREAPGASTREIQSLITAPGRLRIEKRGDYLSMSAALPGRSLQPTGGSLRIQFKEPFYVGLAVCAHDASGLEKAEFSKVEVSALPPVGTAKPRVESTLEIIDVASMDRLVVHHTTDRIEAPNWSRDGTYLLFNSNGRIFKIPVGGGQPQVLDTGVATRCNNDHGISSDGKQLAISDQSNADNKSRIFLLPIGGGAPRQITPKVPSYWHGWSPDGQTLAYCAERAGEYDVYTIPVTGGAERRLTTARGLDDGPDYSPDGKFIYFNSERSGLMQIWRMKPDGGDQEQVTWDDYNNWFAHPSPDGKGLVFLSYPKDVKGHPENKDVMLRWMPTAGGEVRALAKLFGGQGTINVPSWSPDSQRLAFVSYQNVYP